jgi:hypothetical protein
MSDEGILKNIFRKKVLIDDNGCGYMLVKKES